MTWDEALIQEKDKPYFTKLSIFLKNEYKEQTIYPPADMVMNAMNLVPLEKVKCVILGQDPYHGPNQAMGLSFSVQDGITPPPSLKNIYKEIENEFGMKMPENNGNLTPWAKQGVLLLNTILTVRAHSPRSHENKGWENYTDAVINAIETQNRPIVYMLWGNNAKTKKLLVKNPMHLVLESSHPSPYSASGFFGNGHFFKCNDYLVRNGETPINWIL